MKPLEKDDLLPNKCLKCPYSKTGTDEVHIHHNTMFQQRYEMSFC